MWGGFVDQRTTLKIGSNLENNETKIDLKGNNTKSDFVLIKVLIAQGFTFFLELSLHNFFLINTIVQFHMIFCVLK
jgi:hypothetical protein